MSKSKQNSIDAIIFVPGLGTEAVNQHIDTIARRLSGALERQTDSAKARFQLVFISGIIWTVLIYMAVVVTAGIRTLEQGPSTIDGLKDGGKDIVSIAKKLPDYFSKIAGKKSPDESESTDEPYTSVHIVAFSFGSVVSLDLLFPHSRPGARIGTIKNLVSIGCPFDIIRTYWPAYFKDRQKKSNVPEKWVNIYASLDVFGSNYGNRRWF